MRTSPETRATPARQGHSARRPLGVALAAVVVLALSVAFLVDRNRSTPPASIGHFRQVATPARIPGQPVPLFFLSALYCPFCGAERWAIVDALGRFGTWQNLNPSQSTAGVDGIAAVPTYDFVHAAYTSSYVAFVARDAADAQGNPLQPLQPGERDLVNRYDREGGIPLLVVDGAFTQVSSGYSPGLLAGKSFEEIHAGLGGGSVAAVAIHHEADVLSALICYADGGQPRDVCAAPAVRAIVQGIR